MKAWILHDVADLRYEVVRKPIITEKDVLIAVKAVGICGSDIQRIFQSGAHRMPLIPGHEFSGQVVAAGEKVDPALMGARVGVFPLIPCNTCIPCRKKQYELCRKYGYLGSRQDGAFAEYVSVPVWNLLRLPDQVSYEQAAMLEPLSVAVHAMRRVPLDQAAGTVVVCGLGTIGMFLLLLLRDAGIHNILAIGNKEHQRNAVLKAGVPADHYCDSSSEDISQWIMERTGGSGADVFFECIGKEETIISAVNSAAPTGRVCLVGNPRSDVHFEKAIYWKILRNQIEITGSWNSSFKHDQQDDWHYALEVLIQKRIAPENLISHRFQLGDLDRGLSTIRDNSETSAKIIGIIE